MTVSSVPVICMTLMTVPHDRWVNRVLSDTRDRNLTLRGGHVIK